MTRREFLKLMERGRKLRKKAQKGLFRMKQITAEQLRFRVD